MTSNTQLMLTIGFMGCLVVAMIRPKLDEVLRELKKMRSILESGA